MENLIQLSNHCADIICYLTPIIGLAFLIALFAYGVLLFIFGVIRLIEWLGR